MKTIKLSDAATITAAAADLGISRTIIHRAVSKNQLPTYPAVDGSQFVSLQEARKWNKTRPRKNWKK